MLEESIDSERNYHHHYHEVSPMKDDEWNIDIKDEISFEPEENYFSVKTETVDDLKLCNFEDKFEIHEEGLDPFLCSGRIKSENAHSEKSVKIEFSDLTNGSLNQDFSETSESINEPLLTKCFVKLERLPLQNLVYQIKSEFNDNFFSRRSVQNKDYDIKLPIKCEKSEDEDEKIFVPENHLEIEKEEDMFDRKKCSTVQKVGSSFNSKCNPNNFKSKSILFKHKTLKSASNEYSFKCEYCSVKFSKKTCIRYHILKTHHTLFSRKDRWKKTQHKCKTCAKHEIGENLICHVCKKSFKFKHKFNKHVKCHDETRPHRCSLCSAKFKRPFHLKRHMLCHSENRPFECSECSFKFKSECELKLHLRCHKDDRPHQCPLCPSKFKRPDTLNEHIRRHDTGRSHICPICSMNYKCAQDLKKHTFKCHNKKPKRLKSRRPNSKPRKIKCEND